MAVSLYKLPRLASAKAFPRFIHPTLMVLVVGGLLLQTISQLSFFYSPMSLELKFGVAAGSLLIAVGIIVFVVVIARVVHQAKVKAEAVAAKEIWPFLVISLCGWLLYAFSQVIAAISFLNNSSFLFDATVNNLAVQTFIFALLLPTCFAFSISTFPIFLRLRAPTWPVRRVASVYAIGVAMNLGALSAISYFNVDSFRVIAAIGGLIRSLAIIWFIIELDLLRFHAPWFRKYRDNADRANHPPRRYTADYGQFGNFEWIIYAAYLWLGIASLYDIWNEMLVIVGTVPVTGLIAQSILRHLYLLGFVTHLILGMAVRMVPGFLGKNAVAYPKLVNLSFLFISLAIISRILPLWFSMTDILFFRRAYGLSGILAILAIACLGVNLYVTASRQKKKQL
jgi:hypothetical protein